MISPEVKHNLKVTLEEYADAWRREGLEQGLAVAEKILAWATGSRTEARETLRAWAEAEIEKARRP